MLEKQKRKYILGQPSNILFKSVGKWRDNIYESSPVIDFLKSVGD